MWLDCGFWREPFLDLVWKVLHPSVTPGGVFLSLEPFPTPSGVGYALAPLRGSRCFAVNRRSPSGGLATLPIFKLKFQVSNLQPQISNLKSQISNLKSQILLPSTTGLEFRLLAALGHCFRLCELLRGHLGC